MTTEPTLTNLYVYEDKSCTSELNERYRVTKVYLHKCLRRSVQSTQYIYTIINCCRGEKVIVTDSPSLQCLLMSSMSSCLLEMDLH